MRGNEIINGQPIRVFDSSSGYDRYTVVFMRRADWGYTRKYIRETGQDYYPCLGMSASPFHPQGIGMHSAAKLGKHLGKRIPFKSLPEDCRKLVMRDLE